MVKPYQLIIVGGGLAGLTVAECLAKHKTFSNILILEQYKKMGGRVSTVRNDGLTYEAGAGRIFHAHARVGALVKRFGLKTYPIGTESYLSTGTPNPFLHLFEPIRQVLSKCDQATLESNTLYALVPDELRNIFQYYPYWAEIHDLRADLALPAFAPTHPMGASKPDDFYGIQGGMDQLTEHLSKECAQLGVQLKTQHNVTNIKQRTDSLFEITGADFTYQARHVVIATSRGDYSRFDVLKHSPLLKQLVMSPLIRIYAVYPPDPDTGRVWFPAHKIVTDNPLRYIIPIRQDTGLIMISYTDGDDTNHWRTLKGQALEDAIQTELHKVFPDTIIPKPTWIKSYDWPFGCTYWVPTPGNTTTLFEAQNPLPNLYICGESVSQHQGWMEGALESADYLTDHLKNLFPM
jgi:monoamine oxidase